MMTVSYCELRKGNLPPRNTQLISNQQLIMFFVDNTLILYYHNISVRALNNRILFSASWLYTSALHRKQALVILVPLQRSPAPLLNYSLFSYMSVSLILTPSAFSKRRSMK
jgi:hypothetical protein